MPAKPTTKQKKAAELLVGNGGNVTKAMLDAGYSINTANTPQKLTESEGFKVAISKYEIDPDLVAFVMKEGLQATRESRKGEERPDYGIRHKYMETAMRALGLQGADTGTTNTYNTFVQENHIDPNSDEYKDRKAKITKILLGES